MWIYTRSNQTLYTMRHTGCSAYLENISDTEGNGHGSVIAMMLDPIIKGGWIQIVLLTIVLFGQSTLFPGVEILFPLTVRIPFCHISPPIRCIE